MELVWVVTVIFQEVVVLTLDGRLTAWKIAYLLRAVVAGVITLAVPAEVMEVIRVECPVKQARCVA